MTQPQSNKTDYMQADQVNGLVAAAGVDGVRQIMDAFRRSTADLVATLSESIENGELDEASRAAHAIKGSAGNVGAQSLAECISAIEQACESGDTAAARAGLQDVQENFDRFCEVAEAHLANL